MFDRSGWSPTAYPKHPGHTRGSLHHTVIQQQQQPQQQQRHHLRSGSTCYSCRPSLHPSTVSTHAATSQKPCQTAALRCFTVGHLHVSATNNKHMLMRGACILPMHPATATLHPTKPTCESRAEEVCMSLLQRSQSLHATRSMGCPQHTQPSAHAPDPIAWGTRPHPLGW
jgi:hypothetical protein